MKRKNLRKNLIYLSLFFVFSELFKQILLTVHRGSYDFWYFPFQLCSMPMYLLPLYLHTRNKSLAVFMRDFFLLAGIAVFFDQTGMLYDLPILTFHSYLWHILMIFTSILLFFYEEDIDDLRSFLKGSAVYLILALIAECFNFLFHAKGSIDMFYISPFSPMDQIIFRDIAKVIGEIPVIFLYLFMTILGAGILHFLMASINRKKDSESPSSGKESKHEH